MNQIEFAHSATVCAKLEGELRASISRTQSAIQEAQAAIQGMLDIIDQGRAERGLPPLDDKCTPAKRRTDAFGAQL